MRVIAMKKYLLTTVMGLLITLNVQAESVFSICKEEAIEAGIEDQAEIRVYVDDCVEQLQAEGVEIHENMEGESSEGNQDNRQVEES